MMECPCRDCYKRNPYCHGECEKYLEWASHNKKLRKKIREKERVENLYYSGKPKRRRK